MNFTRFNVQSLKYKRFTQSGIKDVVMFKLEFVARNSIKYKKRKIVKVSSMKIVLFMTTAKKCKKRKNIQSFLVLTMNSCY